MERPGLKILILKWPSLEVGNQLPTISPALLLLRQSPPVEGHAYADDDAGGVAQAEDIHGINRK